MFFKSLSAALMSSFCSANLVLASATSPASSLTNGKISIGFKFVIPATKKNVVFQDDQIVSDYDSTRPFCVVKLAQPTNKDLPIQAREVEITGVQLWHDTDRDTAQSYYYTAEMFTSHDPMIHSIECGEVAIPNNSGHSLRQNVTDQILNVGYLRSTLTTSARMGLTEPAPRTVAPVSTDEPERTSVPTGDEGASGGSSCPSGYYLTYYNYCCMDGTVAVGAGSCAIRN